VLDCVWNVMAHAQKPDFVFRRNGRVHLNRRGRQFSRLLAAQVCASPVVMLDTPCAEVVWRVVATHSICQFSLHFPSRASLCAITFQLDSTCYCRCRSLRGNELLWPSCVHTGFAERRCANCWGYIGKERPIVKAAVRRFWGQAFYATRNVITINNRPLHVCILSQINPFQALQFCP